MPTETGSKILGYFEKERAAVNGLLSQHDEQAWDGAQRGDGWTAAEILGHMAEAVYAFVNLSGNSLNGKMLSHENLSIDGFNEENHARHKQLTFAQIRELWDEAANRFSSWVPELTDEQFAHRGMTPFGQEAAVSEVLTMSTFHLRNHRKEIQEALESYANR